MSARCYVHGKSRGLGYLDATPQGYVCRPEHVCKGGLGQDPGPVGVAVCAEHGKQRSLASLKETAVPGVYTCVAGARCKLGHAQKRAPGVADYAALAALFGREQASHAWATPPYAPLGYAPLFETGCSSRASRFTPGLEALLPWQLCAACPAKPHSPSEGADSQLCSVHQKMRLKRYMEADEGGWRCLPTNQCK